MKVLKREQPSASFNLIDIISEESLKVLNRFTRKNYRKVKKVSRASLKENMTFAKNKKLMQEIPRGRLY